MEAPYIVGNGVCFKKMFRALRYGLSGNIMEANFKKNRFFSADSGKVWYEEMLVRKS